MGSSELLASIRECWRPPPDLQLDEWADRFAVLSSESSAEPGRWKTYGFQRGIMRAFTDRRIEQVSVMKSARVGYTKMLNHACAYYIHQDPCPIMIVQPTDGDAEGYSKDEIAPMLRDTPCLQGLVSEARSRDSGNTLSQKQFPGGVLQFVGANSPRGFRRVTRRVVGFDEVDGYPQSAGPEGDQIKLGINRTLTFHNRKIIAGSTPTLESTSRIARLFDKSDQRYFYVPCPDCDHKQVLKMAQLRWTPGKPETVLYHCEACGVGIPHHKKRRMIEEADRRQQTGEEGIGWVATKPEVKGHAGFHIWAGYSYAPNATWEHLAREFEDCHKNPEELKTFVNTVLGETWKGKGEAPDWQRLYDRREPYETNKLPPFPVYLFAGADIQKDRIEVEVLAIGERLNSWSIDYRVFPGDTSNKDAEPWQRLEAMLSETWQYPNGVPVTLRMLAVDAGYNTNVVLSWVRGKSSNRVIAVKGVEGLAVPIGQPTAVDVSLSDGKKKARGAKQWPVGTNILKTELYGWLKLDRPTEESGDKFPIGYCHFPEYAEEFFRQLTAEELVYKIIRGYKRGIWQKTRDRNEALDCRNYARAASILCGVDRIRAEDWLAMGEEAGLFHVKQEGPAAKPEPAKTVTVNGVEITRKPSTYWRR